MYKTMEFFLSIVLYIYVIYMYAPTTAVLYSFLSNIFSAVKLKFSFFYKLSLLELVSYFL